MPARRKPKPGGRIEKAEDRAWQEWFKGIKEKEHDQYLHQLGLDDEDVKEWHGMHGNLDKFEEEMMEEAAGEKEGKQKKASKAGKGRKGKKKK